jgi:uncharacterized protein (TIGR04255 family)
MNMTQLEEIRYQRNFLKNVIFRIDFSPIVRLQKELSPDFQDSLRDNFPSLEAQVATEFHTAITEGRRIDETLNSHLWHFNNSERTQRIIISYKSLVIEFLEYTHFSEFSQIVEKVYSVFSNIYKPIDLQRLGLRYVNNIVMNSGHPLEWAELINPHLTHQIEHFIADKTQLSRAMSQSTLLRGDHTIVFSYGIYNSEFPARISRKEYILDYDCFTTDFENDDLMVRLYEYNKEILELFENSITDGLREKMGGRV